MIPSPDSRSALPDRTDHLVSVVAVLVLAAVCAVTSPELGMFRGAIVPWPAHGLTVAIVLVTPPALRIRMVGVLGFALLVALAPAARELEMSAARLVGAVAILLGQAVLITLLHQRWTRGLGALSSTSAYAAMIVAVIVGTLPMTLVAAITLRVTGVAERDGFTIWAWWSTAASSGAAITGLTIALLSRGDPQSPSALTRQSSFSMARRSPSSVARRAEFVVLIACYIFALVSAFAELGPLAGQITPGLAALPFLVWGGMRFGVRGFAVVALLLITAIMLSTALDLGPFGRFDEDKLARYRRAYVYVAALVGPAMIFPVALAERAEADNRTRSALAQLRTVFEGASDRIAGIDRNLTLIAANRAWVAAFERMLGVRPQPGMNVADIWPGRPDEARISVELWRRALAGEHFAASRVIEEPDGSAFEFEITYSPVLDENGVVMGASQVVRNISERRRREAEDAEVRRLESIGRLAGGVAHDFNNLMTAVMGYAEMVHDSLDATDPRREDVAEIQRAAARAGELTQQLLAFARRKEVRPLPVDVATQLHGMSRLLTSLLGAQVELQVEIADELPALLIDPTQFDQAVMNLAVNARDAMPDGGTFRIVATHGSNGGVLLTVSDTGVGMSREVQARVFEPFFTTKPLGQGTGLGLSTVHGVVHQAGGAIDVESAPGRGTTFRLDFPAVDLTPAPPASPPPLPSAARRSGPRTP